MGASVCKEYSQHLLSFQNEEFIFGKPVGEKLSLMENLVNVSDSKKSFENLMQKTEEKKLLFRTWKTDLSGQKRAILYI